MNIFSYPELLLQKGGSWETCAQEATEMQDSLNKDAHLKPQVKS